MDDTQSFSSDSGMEQEFPPAEEPRMEAPPQITTDERRMHVRAYNYWVSLLEGRPYPSIEDLDPSNIEDFGPHSVLLDFTSGPENAAIPFLGAALRAEGGITDSIRSIDDVPTRSVLSRLTDHYLEIIANHAPIGFEAEYVNQRNVPTMYRGILMPFSSDGDTIDFIYGVINWKEVAQAEVADDIRDAVNSAFSEPAPAPAAVAPIWADGPHANALEEVEPAETLYELSEAIEAHDAEDEIVLDSALAIESTPLPADAGLYDRLAAARDSVDALSHNDQRSRAALYRALGNAFDFALAAAADPGMYSEILVDAGIKAQDRAPMTPVVKLIFGVGYDKTRLAEYAAVLSYGYRESLSFGDLPNYIESFDGGLKAVVQAERALRRPEPEPNQDDAAREKLTQAPVLATVTVDGVTDDFVNLVARREPDGSLSILAVTRIPDTNLVKVAKKIKS